MPKLLQINVVSNMLSTGKIANDIAVVAQSNGWETFIAYGRWAKHGCSKEIKVGTKLDMYRHYICNRFFDNEGLSSSSATRKLIKQIDDIEPDLIHLHNIHDHYINYPILFKYIKERSIPVVWTQHDCWAFTGGCMYFDTLNCSEWMTGCRKCKEHRSLFINRSARNFSFKKKYVEQLTNIVFVPVSNWIAELLASSSLKNKPIKVIHNGIDTNLFKPIKTNKVKDEFAILGVSAVWDYRKGFNDFLKLRTLLPSDIKIVLVGLNKDQISHIPEGITGIPRTSSIEELVKLYSNADVFVNPTYSDNFPTTNLEALACGTPVITYRTGGSPEAIDKNTGIIVEKGDIQSLAQAIINIKQHPLSSDACRKRVENNFNKNNCFMHYIELYNDLLKNCK